MYHTIVFITIFASALTYQVDPSTSFLQDDYGRNVFIHGMNSVYK